MTSLLSAPDRPAVTASDLRHRRPLTLVAALGGVAAAGTLLTVCLALGVTGWFLADAGTHGQPRDALRVGALAWLMAHGSGVVVAGVTVTAVPLLLTLAAGWLVWRLGHTVGDLVSGHGPDSDQISDGERDWTVPSATLLFAVGYAAVTSLTLALAGTPATAPSGPRALGWSLLLALLVGGPAIAVGSGRAAIWAAVVPAHLRAAAATCGAIVRTFLLVSLVALLAALALDLGTAANVVSGLHLSAGETSVYALVSALLLPNATVFAGSYLLGPGFAVGTQTLVSPTIVLTGPLPAFPLLAALPDSGPTPAWTVWLVALPALVAAYAAARAQRRRPTLRWDRGALRGCVGGVSAGVVIALLAGVAGGAVGPGRMQVVGPVATEVMVHAVTSFGIGGLVGGLLMTWWQRRSRA
ncbi:cell division protein PerM [Nocardioides sp. GXQ0305]|uniref:cell division protein PerM n=1 Tax=Nocardioides sp. GXQ0305 TaxID=3423912 RepID=UPI003D7ED9BE